MAFDSARRAAIWVWELDLARLDLVEQRLVLVLVADDFLAEVVLLPADTLELALPGGNDVALAQRLVLRCPPEMPAPTPRRAGGSRTA